MGSLKRHGFSGAVAMSVLITGALAGCGTRQESATLAHSDTALVKLGGGAKFTPAPPSAKPTLTARQAWASYTKVNTSYRNAAIPRNVSVHLGLLTLPIGPAGPGGTEKYLAHNLFVYGYSWHRCPEIPTAPGSGPVSVPPNPCIEWNFLNAKTGHQIVQTWQIS